jgi:hypothetical protein
MWNGHCNGNHKAKLAYVTPKLVHPFVHAPNKNETSSILGVYYITLSCTRKFEKMNKIMQES